ncbi:MAG: hypothetical protein NTW33_12080 [Methanoregula sp.]|nr:hypothetical protein [Methanoregula sp.]
MKTGWNRGDSNLSTGCPIAGKLLGMGTSPVFLAILAGALIGCFIIALGPAAVHHF